MRTFWFAIAIAAASACGGKATPTTTTTTTAAPASVLELGEITVSERGQAMLKIHADGSTELGGHSGEMKLVPGQTASTDALPIKWEAGPKIGTDGTLSKDGDARVRVSADGKVVDAKGNQTLPITLGADKVEVMNHGGTFTIQLAADGALTIPELGGTDAGSAMADMHVDGADTAGKRRTVLLLIALSLLSEGPGAVPPPQVTPQAAPASSSPTH
jgi:hypothetical protein|nr:hypothetical protein [Kofleriaceae bacterium]